MLHFKIIHCLGQHISINFYTWTVKVWWCIQLINSLNIEALTTTLALILRSGCAIQASLYSLCCPAGFEVSELNFLPDAVNWPSRDLSPRGFECSLYDGARSRSRKVDYFDLKRPFCVFCPHSCLWTLFLDREILNYIGRWR